MSTGLSLYHIDETIAQLVDLREEVTDEQECEVIDAQIKEWVAAEVTKVAKCYAYIKRQEQEAEMAKEVARQAVQWQHRHEGRAQRIRQMVLEVMQARQLRKLEGPGIGSFTVRGSGGAQPLDIFDEARIPDTFRSVELQIPKTTWLAIQLLLEDEGPILRVLLANAREFVDGKCVRAALEKGETVDGARLAERGTSLMIR